MSRQQLAGGASSCPVRRAAAAASQTCCSALATERKSNWCSGLCCCGQFRCVIEGSVCSAQKYASHCCLYCKLHQIQLNRMHTVLLFTGGGPRSMRAALDALELAESARQLLVQRLDAALRCTARQAHHNIHFDNSSHKFFFLPAGTSRPQRERTCLLSL